MARTCNLILIVLDCLKPLTHKKLIEHELEGFGIRLNQKPPRIIFKRREKGGLSINSTVQMTQLDPDTIKSICNEYKVHNATLTFHEDANADQLIDVIEGNRYARSTGMRERERERSASVVMRPLLTITGWRWWWRRCRVYIPCLYVMNKIDQITIEELDVLDRLPHVVPISAHHEWNLDELLERAWEYLDLIRMYVSHSPR